MYTQSLNSEVQDAENMKLRGNIANEKLFAKKTADEYYDNLFGKDFLKRKAEMITKIYPGLNYDVAFNIAKQGIPSRYVAEE